MAMVASFGSEPVPASSLSPIAMARPPIASYPPPPYVSTTRRTGQIAALAIIVAALLCLVVVLVARPNALALGSGGKGSLVITASGPGNAPLGKLTVYADDVARCESSPCRIADLTSGTHFIRIAAPGYLATAARAVSVTGGSEEAVHVQLSRGAEAQETAAQERVVARDEPTPAAAARPVEPAADAPTPVAHAVVSKPRGGAAVVAAAAKPADGAARSGNGKLNINAIPAANVVLDGRPLGRTPLAGVSVSAGSHTVVFIGADGTRRVASADVPAGGTKSVGVKF
jgi:hypothetical protein